MFRHSTFVFVSIVLIIGQETDSNNAGNDVNKLTEKAYAKIFKESRKEGKELLQIIIDESKYERKYKLLEGAYDKLLNTLQETRNILRSSKYDAMVDKFPSQDARLLDALTVTLENTCVFGELILHNPDMSYRILESRKNGPAWKELLNWCIKYTRKFNDRIIDTKSQELLWLTEQEINPEKRTDDFINPYRDRVTDKDNMKKKKPAKKLPKGPQMVTRDEF